jgi:hypothetical protein
VTQYQIDSSHSPELPLGGNRTSLRKRDGAVLDFQYDVLNRMTVKVVPDRFGPAAQAPILALRSSGA